MSVLKRIEGSRFSVVNPLWKDKTVVLIGGGPSLTCAQVAVVMDAHAVGDVRVIAVNDAYLLSPFADVLYFADDRWHGWHSRKEQFKKFSGQKCSITLAEYATESEATPLHDDSVHVLRRGTEWGLSRNPYIIHTGRNSGMQALNIAVLAGARRVLLLGIDCKPSSEKSHWFGSHPVQEPDAVYVLYRMGFENAVNDLHDIGVNVVNCSPDSALTCFPKASIESLLFDTRSALVSA